MNDAYEQYFDALPCYVTIVDRDFKIIRARKRVRDELLDAAIEVAMERLPGMITAADSQRFVDQYIASARRKSERR